jgi:hypothetical protein
MASSDATRILSAWSCSDQRRRVANDLAGSIYVTLIARFVVDDHGNMLRGELAETDSNRVLPFVGWGGFTGTLVTCLTRLADQQRTDKDRQHED